MQLKLPKLQESDLEAKDLRSKDLLEGWEDVKGILQHQGLLYISKIIYSKVISCHYDNLLAEHFEI